MCGIIGIVGIKPVTERLIDSLKRLEYRGYDSAGVATICDGKVDRRRASGKLRALEAVRGGGAACAEQSASATPAGPPTARRTCATPTRRRPAASPWFTTASSRTSPS